MRRLAPLVLFLIAGCGGEGGGSKPAPEATRTLVAQALTDLQGAFSYSQYGMEYDVLTYVATGIEPVRRPAVGVGLGGAPESGPFPSFFYWDVLGLWVDQHREVAPLGEEYYVDEAKTQPAGSQTVTESGETIVERYEITAGPFAGARGEDTATYRDEGPSDDDDYQNDVYDRFAPDGTRYQGGFTYVGFNLKANGTTRYSDGRQDAFSATLDENERGTLTFRSRQGVEFDLRYQGAKVVGGVRIPSQGWTGTVELASNGTMAVRLKGATAFEFPSRFQSTERSRTKSRHATP